MSLTTAFALLGGVAISTQAAIAQTRNTPTGDARVKAALDKAGLKYEVDRDGDFKLVMELPNDRTQLVFVRSETQKLNDNYEIREIISPAFKSDGALSSEIANRLLTDSAKKKLGGWQTISDGNSSIAIFCSKVMANSNAESLVASIQATVLTADDMEKQLTNKDDF
ncbi:hypothetical protein NIES2104_13960 [Leptolyngbya sp. NIES-2104]|nr:hypothetical protein NIES2104_13960 [Leptolyngbya sp. NIES-2104]